MNRRSTLIKYVVPSVMGMVSIFLFTIVDGIFVGRGVGTDGLGAVNIAFPFVMIYGAFCMLTTIGGLTITAIRVGRGDRDGANDAFMHSLVMTFIICVLMTLAGTCLTTPLARLLGANDTYLSMTCDYLFWYSVFIIPCSMGNTLMGFCRNDGAPVLVSAATIIATVFNIIADWVFIFPLHMGLKGAAVATGLAQTIAFGIMLMHFLLKKGELRFCRFRPQGYLFKMIAVRGLPECISQFSVPLGTVLTNNMLIRLLGDSAVNAYSVICYAASFAAAAFAGTAEGLQPVFGNCYGAKREDDLRWFFRAGAVISVAGSAGITVIVLLLWRGICFLFGVEGASEEMAMRAMPQYSWGFIMQAVCVIVSGYLYSTTRTRQALVINILRSFVFNTAVILLVPVIFGADAIWYTFGIYEGLTAIVSVILLRRADRNGAIGAAE